MPGHTPPTGDDTERAPEARNQIFKQNRRIIMKKRLLSAALALAMVLTMLPLTVFAANGENGDTVTYYAKNKVAINQDGELNPNPGWFYDSGLKVIKDTKETSTKVYHEKTTGVITGTSNSGKWYGSITEALTEGKASTIKIIGSGAGDLDLSYVTGTSLTIDINGYGFSISGSSEKLTSLKIQNSAQKKDGSWPTVGGTIAVSNQNFTYDATKTNSDNGPSISLTNTSTTARTLTVKLTDAGAGDITTVKAKAAITMTNSASKSLAIAGNSSAITLTNSTVDGGVSLTGTGTSITVNGSLSEIKNGNVTLVGSTVETKSGAAPKVTVNGGKISGTVQNDASVEKLTNAKYTVAVNSGSNAEINAIDLTNADVTVNGGTVKSSIKLATGSLSVTNNGSVGAVTWGSTDTTVRGTLNLTVSGENTTVTSVAPASGTAVTLGKVAITGGVFNGTFDLGKYADNGVTGGAFKTSLLADAATAQTKAANWLGKSNQYIEVTGDGYYYYVGSNFQDLVDRWAKIEKSDKNNPPSPTARRVNYDLVKDNGYTITFVLETDKVKGDVVLAAVKGNANDAMLAPSSVNNVSVSNWYVLDNTVPDPNSDKVYAAGRAIPFSEDVKVCVTLPGGDGSDIIRVTAEGGISAELNGSVIKLSGYAPANDTDGFPISLTITTVKKTYTNAVTVNWWYNLKTFGLSNATAPFSAEVSNTLTYNGKIYTFDISGLKLMSSSNIGYVIGADTDLVGEDSLNAGKIKSVVVSFNAGEKASQATFAEDMSDPQSADAINFSNSPAIMEALNREAGKLTTLKTYTDAAKRAYAKQKHEINNPTVNDLDLYGGGYDQVVLQPFLNVTVSAYTPGGGGNVGSMTTNIVPWYYILVINSSDPTVEPYIYNTKGTSLGTLSGDYGTVEFTLGLPTNFASSTTNRVWVHHDSKYAYEGTSDSGKSVKFETLHGFSPFIINGVASAVEVDKVQGMPNRPVYYYDSLQEAVDAVADGGTITLHEDYKKETTVSITGVARNFEVDPGPNGNLSLTFNGVGVSNERATGGAYRVTLSASNVLETSASISLSTYSNGTVSLSSTYAKQGSTVTITATGYSGYTPLTPTVTADNGASVVVSGSNGRYSFVVPNGARTITVRPSFVYSSGSNWNGGGNSGNNGNTSNNGNNGNTGYNLPFTDVIAGAWYTDAVAYCYNTYAGGSRLMQGVNTAGDRFGVNSPMTRAELVEVMWRIAGSPVETPRTYFTDVRSSDWYYNSMSWAANHGYVTGYGDGTALPNRSISRQELAAILYRFGAGGTLSSSMRNFNLANRYPDGQGVASWAQDAMKWAAFTGILSGQGRATMNRLDAYATAYRSELAVTIRNFYQYYYEV